MDMPREHEGPMPLRQELGFATEARVRICLRGNGRLHLGLACRLLSLRQNFLSPSTPKKPDIDFLSERGLVDCLFGRLII